MTTRVVGMMLGLAILSAVLLGRGEKTVEPAPVQKCTGVMAPGSSC